MDPVSTEPRPGVSRNFPAECEVLSPEQMANRRGTGIVVNRDHLVGFIFGAALFAGIYYFFRKLEK